MKQKLLLGAACLAIAGTTLFTACSKSNSNVAGNVPDGQQKATLYMTDGPGFYDKVVLNVQSVEVLVDTSKNTRRHDGWDWDFIGSRSQKPDSALVWYNLNATAGSYDLLQLRNGVDTLLGSANVAAGSMRLIRIDLGTNNYFVKDSVKYPLSLPPGAPSYILIKLLGNEWEQYASNSYRLWLDFNVQRSIVQLRNNQFYLIPYMTAFVVSKTGTVVGSILPNAAWPEIISVYNSTDTAYAIPNFNGQFKIRGLQDGVYSVLVNPSNGYKDTTLTNITITNSSTASVGSVLLRK